MNKVIASLGPLCVFSAQMTAKWFDVDAAFPSLHGGFVGWKIQSILFGSTAEILLSFGGVVGYVY